MLYERGDVQVWDSPWETDAPSPPAPRWTVLIPFFNERTLLDGTLASLAAQDVPFNLILIDNASTDGSADCATAACDRLGLAFTLLLDRRPGKVNALQSGLARTRTPFVATCDADTIYPTDYLRQAESMLEAKQAVAGGAYFAASDATIEDHRAASARMARAAMLLPAQCHTGGAGQVFRTDALRRAGGFDAARWGYVLEDHEIMHRMAKLGPLAHGGKLWCSPSPRERDRDSIRWTLTERILYHATPGPARDWFFYDFLARRLAARRLTSDRIRERQFYADIDFSCGVPRTA
ncbi:glycosyltransferase [Sphingomonas sp. MMS24-J45]|uniref:glycosyltransferase n=1 Tax=Sphingomonas sp. MMS24-J45 TaxID=3238806 RepID=UPI00384B2360